MSDTNSFIQTAPSRGIVLVVDDEEGIRQLARRILEGAGYGVVEAKDGVDGLRMVEAGIPVDFLMADLDMPNMRGDQMAIEIRARRPELKVLYVSAHIASLKNRRRVLSDDEAFVVKPFTAAALLEAVALLKTGRITPDASQPSTASWRKRWLGF
jgi:two-component system, cell cycle sensor histidine kinase and response regulator CckA